LPSDNLSTGDVLLGLASSGVHSNGFSLVRRIVEMAGLDWSSLAPFDHGKSLGAALLEPTRIYVKPLLAAIRETGGVKAMAHITGGGFTENIPRVLPDHLGAEIDLSTISPPPVFGWMANTGGVEQTEMLRTFNCGIGMVVVVSSQQVDAVTAVLEQNGEQVVTLGALSETNPGNVSFSGTLAW